MVLEQAHRLASSASSVVTMPPSPVVMILLPKKLKVAMLPDGPRPAAPVLRAVRLGGVLEHEQAVPAARASIGVHVDGLAEQVDRR